MYFVDPKRYDRGSLSQDHMEFLLRVVPLAGFVQQQTYNKALVTGKDTNSGIYSSVIAAHILAKSSFGDHPIARPNFKALPANNLALLEVHKYWKKLSLEHDGVVYRGYKNWREFAIDFSDMLSWHSGWEDALKTKLIRDQIERFSERENNVAYRDTIITLIKQYGLQEFDWHAV